MSFFGDLKSITKASFKAVGDGVELFAELAEDVSQSSEKLLISSRLDRAEKEFVQHSLNDASESQIKSSWTEFNEHYDELLPKSSEAERKSLIKRRRQLEVILDQSSIKQLESEIECLTRSIAGQRFSLPVRQIEALNRKKLACSKLLKLCQRNDREELKASALSMISQIEAQVKELEVQRTEVVTEEHSDGGVKRRFRMRDGELNGITEASHQNGARRFSIDFVDGRFEGKSEYWREDGSLAFTISRDSAGRSTHRLLLPGGQRIAECNLSVRDGRALLWFWDGYFIGSAKLVGGRASKFLLMLKLIFRPGFWIRLRRASQNGPDAESLKAMQATIQLWDGFLSELNDFAPAK